jgi:large subunit ribosomal protein L31
MKKDIHPNYRDVVFYDTSSEFKFLTKSTVETSETTVWEDGKTYPVYKVEVSSNSHPFYTGKKMLLDTAGRVEKFNKRYAKK